MNRALPSGTVTLLFSDVEGSTHLLDALGDAYGAVLQEHRRLLREAWTAHRGVEVDTAGDGFFVAFEQAPHAAAAAIQAQGALAAHVWPGGRALRVRIGIHTGVPQVQGDGYWGADVHYAARLAAAGHGGQVLVSATAAPLLERWTLESLGEHGLKDFAAERELFHLVIDGARADSFPPPRTLARPRGNLPLPATELVGRERELDELIARCTDGERLITVLGPGGSGKTRLAMELGHRVAERFESVWFVALEEVAQPEEVIGAIVRTLRLPGAPELDRLVDHLGGRRVLLLVDNAEHLVDAAPQLGRLAAAGDGVRLVVTSQTPLRVGAERLLRLEPLVVPTGAEHDIAELAAVPAVALLRERAAQAGTPLDMTDVNAADVARLCNQLEGMPLAIELAASRLNVLDPGALSRRLEAGLDALGTGSRDLPARQRGLRAVLEWTEGLLTDDERRVLAQLSVFAADFEPALVEAAFGDRLDELATLIDVGLVRRSEAGRLQLRPPVRRYASELLDDSDAAHRAVGLAFAELAEPFEARWMLLAGEGRAALNADGANLAAALDWARDHDSVLHARLAAATAWWMNYSNRAAFIRAHLDLALSRTDDPRLRARCLQALGTLGLESADPDYSLHAADAWHALGDAAGEVMSLAYAANLLGHRGDGAAEMGLVERAEQVIAGLQDPQLTWMVDAVRADALTILGRHAEAAAVLQPLLDQAEPGSWAQFWATTKRADLALAAGDNARALALYGVAMRVLLPFDSLIGQLIQADTAAAALAGLGRLDEAATAVGICEYVHAELAWEPAGTMFSALKEAREALDEARLAAGRRHATELGIRGGLDWVRDVALSTESPDRFRP
jgi:predicted ATPase/class 3 adenylate cyclase